MKTMCKYIADDGTEFESKYECMSYELIQVNKDIEGVRFFDEDGKQISLGGVIKDKMMSTYKVVINNMNQYMAFKKVSDINDWTAADDITEPGTWKWFEEFEHFIRIDDLIEEFIGQLKWERDEAFRHLEDIGLSFGHKFKDVTDELGMNTNGINILVKLLHEGNARVIQIGDFNDI